MCSAAALLVLLLAVSCAGDPVEREGAAARPADRVVLLLVVDQLPMELLARDAPRFGGRGLGRFLEQGVVYADAVYPFGSTLTAVAHASLATGRLPRDHGIVGNEWLDRGSGTVVYSAGAGSAGMLVPTVTPSLARAGIPTWAVSLKDRSAIFLAGEAGTPLWYDRWTGRFVSSTTPGPDDHLAAPAPAHRVDASRYLGWTWRPSEPIEPLVRACASGAPGCPPRCESASPFPEPDLPHTISADPAVGFRQIIATPAGDAMTVDLVEALIDDGSIPAGRPAFLAVSLAATDYIGHAFGPESVEYQDNLVHLSETVERLLNLVADHVGDERLVTLLTSDHGTAARAGCLLAQGVPAGRLTAPEVEARADVLLRDELGLPEARARVLVPNLYVTGARADDATLRALAAGLEETPGLARAIPRELLAAARPPGLEQVGEAARALGAHEVLQSAWRSYHPERSGDLVLVQEPHWYFATGGTSAAMHGSPYLYDTHVPLIALGAGLASARVERRVSPLAVAATVVWLLGVEPPAGAEAALPEVVEELAR